MYLRITLSLTYVSHRHVLVWWIRGYSSSYMRQYHSHSHTDTTIQNLFPFLSCRCAGGCVCDLWLHSYTYIETTSEVRNCPCTPWMHPLHRNRPDPIVFLPVVVDTTGRLYDDFSRLLFLHTHHETSALSNEIPESSDECRFLRVVSSFVGDTLFHF